MEYEEQSLAGLCYSPIRVYWEREIYILHPPISINCLSYDGLNGMGNYRPQSTQGYSLLSGAD